VKYVGRFETLFEDGGRLYGMFGGVLPEDGDHWAMWLVDLSALNTSAVRVDRAPSGSDAAVLRLGADLILASAVVHPDFHGDVLHKRRPSGTQTTTAHLLALGLVLTLAIAVSFNVRSQSMQVRVSLIFRPTYHPLVWGGRRMEAWGRSLPGGSIGEAWELADHPRGMSVVSEGSLSGVPMRKIVDRAGAVGRGAPN